MNTRMIRYKVKADRAEENERFIAAVFKQLQQEQPDGLRYAAFRQEDGRSFTHLVQTPDGQDPLWELDAFQAFVANIRDRCEEPPTFVELHPIGVYNLFANS